MAAFIIFRDKAAPGAEAFRNENQVHAVLASGADEAEARTNAKAAARERKDGALLVHDAWAAVQLGSSDLPADLEGAVFTGDLVKMGQVLRG